MATTERSLWRRIADARRYWLVHRGDWLRQRLYMRTLPTEECLELGLRFWVGRDLWMAALFDDRGRQLGRRIAVDVELSEKLAAAFAGAHAAGDDVPAIWRRACAENCVRGDAVAEGRAVVAQFMDESRWLTGATLLSEVGWS